VEPRPNADRLPIDTLFVPTDGTPAAEERVRTLVARTMPHAKTRTYRDYAAEGPAPQPIDAELYEAAVAGAGSLFPVALVFVMLVAACSLTVSTVAGLMERRRPFALLRASGVSVGELRSLALLETAVPLALTVFGGIGTALLVGYLVSPDDFALPGPGFFLGMAAAVLTALAVCLITWPLMNVATRHDNVRFE
jgi:ABC-type antimicrobial peptide transport system permease subunit